jgi:hypothetical protein
VKCKDQCYHYDVRVFVDDNFPDWWLGQSGSVEYPPHSADSIPRNLWDYLKNSVYSTKPATLQEVRYEIEQLCTAIPADTLVNVCLSVVSYCQWCLEVKSSNSEHLQEFPKNYCFCYTHLISTFSESCNGYICLLNFVYIF